MDREKPDLNALTREVQALARAARRLAQEGHNPVAAQSAEHFQQGASDAYRSKDADHLQKNLTALRLLVEELQARNAQA